MLSIRALKGEFFSVELIRDTPMDRNSTRVKNARHSYGGCFLSSSLKTVYVDETRFNLWTKCSYDRSRVGRGANRIVGSQRGRIAAVITATAEWAALLHHNLHFGNLNLETFQLFMVYLEEILGIAHVVVVMDNGPVSRPSQISTYISSNHIHHFLTKLNIVFRCSKVL